MAKKDFMTLMRDKTVDVRPSLLSVEEHIKSQVVILDQLHNLIPPLTGDELSQLEQNVLKHGVKDPLTIWETTARSAGTGPEETPAYILIDGHNRHQLIQKHQLDFRINLVQFTSLEEVKDYMIAYQLGRRNLTPEQASYLRGLRYNRQKVRRGTNLQSDAPLVNVAQVLAAEYGVSSRTIKRDGEFAAGLEQVDPDTKRNVLAGKLPKSILQPLNKSRILAPTQLINGSNQPNLVGLTPAGATNQIDLLKDQIRRLAKGGLDTSACMELAQKANDLLVLLRSK